MQTLEELGYKLHIVNYHPTLGKSPYITTICFSSGDPYYGKDNLNIRVYTINDNGFLWPTYLVFSEDEILLTL